VSPEVGSDLWHDLRQLGAIDSGARGSEIRGLPDRRVRDLVFEQQRVVEVEEDRAYLRPATVRDQGGSAGPWVAVTTRMTARTMKLIAKMPRSRIENTT
jgi:hypothetical protein